MRVDLLVAVVLMAAVVAGCANKGDSPTEKLTFVERPDKEEIIFSAQDVRTIDLAKPGMIIDKPFEVRWENAWERPWKFVISFDYRTLDVKNKAVALLTQPLKDDGSRAPTQLWPSTFTGKREDTYVLGASESFRSVTVDVDLPNIIRKNYRFEWDRRFERAGSVEVKNFKVKLVRRAVNKFRGGEYEIKQTKYFCLKNIFFADKGAVDVDFAFPELKPNCRVVVKNVKGRVLRTVEGKDAAAHLEFPTRGYWELEAIAEYPDGTKIATPGVVSVCGTPIAKDLVRKSRYGIMIVLGTPDLWEKLGSRW